MELVANVWPVVDVGTGLVQRYFMRAYAMDAASWPFDSRPWLARGSSGR